MTTISIMLNVSYQYQLPASVINTYRELTSTLGISTSAARYIRPKLQRRRFFRHLRRRLLADDKLLAILSRKAAKARANANFSSRRTMTCYARPRPREPTSAISCREHVDIARCSSTRFFELTT